jgi:uncharacterized membrane protein YkvA (DUF1232 family)
MQPQFPLTPASPPPQAPGTVMERVWRWAQAVKRDVLALMLAAKDPRMPWYAKALAGIIAAYAFSPIDLIPDFIPVLGYADDLLLLPLGIMLAVYLIPREVMEEQRVRAQEITERPVSRGLPWSSSRSGRQRYSHLPLGSMLALQ